MIKIESKKSCCGCTACKSICPVGAISMKLDEEGFSYPVVNLEKCVDCHLCENVCPTFKADRCSEIIEAYVVRFKDSKIVEESTSGGFFSAIALYFLSRDAVVYGVGFDDDMKVVHKRTETVDGIAEMRGSKFVQSNLNDIFKYVKSDLANDRHVLFTGTPCQIAGLISFLGKKPSNLVCVDFVCRGVSSPGLWRNYIDMMEKKYSSRIIGVKFKNKTYGYHTSTMKIDFQNGKSHYSSGRTDCFMKAFVSELSSRPSCAECSFKSLERLSDITMFDCYKFSELTGKKDDDKGYSSILVHTQYGKKVLEDIDHTILKYKVSVADSIKYNGIMALNSAKQNVKRSEFYKQILSMPIDKAMQLVSPITLIDKIIEFSKKILYKTSLIKFARKLKKERIEINIG